MSKRSWADSQGSLACRLVEASSNPDSYLVPVVFFGTMLAASVVLVLAHLLCGPIGMAALSVVFIALYWIGPKLITG